MLCCHSGVCHPQIDILLVTIHPHVSTQGCWAADLHLFEGSLLQAHKAALESFVKVCRTASTLYELVLYYKLIGSLTAAAGEAKKMIGFSSSMKKAVGDWFLCKTAMDVAMQVTLLPHPPPSSPTPPPLPNEPTPFSYSAQASRKKR